MSSRKKNILVLDSDPEFLIPLQQVLEGEGFDTTVTWDMGEAIALLESRKFDLVLVGEHSPEVRSADILTKLRAMPTPGPCIVLQAADRHPFEAQYLCWFGAHAVIPKWRHKSIVEHVCHSLRHLHGGMNDTVGGEQSSACA